MIRTFLRSILIGGVLLWPAESAVPALAAGFGYGQIFPHFNPYGPGYFEGPFPRAHEHHAYRPHDHVPHWARHASGHPNRNSVRRQSAEPRRAST